MTDLTSRAKIISFHCIHGGGLMFFVNVLITICGCGQPSSRESSALAQNAGNVLVTCQFPQHHLSY